MKIDLHCHTKATKKGDSIKRNVTADKFLDSMINNQVSIVAITNHNVFDIKQYEQFNKICIDKYVNVWPGIELDVSGISSNGHIIVVSDPKQAKEFSNICEEMTKNSTPDNFRIDIDSLCNYFEKLKIVVIAHYGFKNPSLDNEDIEYLNSKLIDKTPLLLETTNLKSAGILLAHNINSFIGSDVKDWNKYNEIELPEFKMPINDFNHFCLLLKKDPEVIKTFINTKKHKELQVQPFEDCSLNLTIYNDINIIFGGKGTGKSKILEAIKNEFELLGNSDVAYFSSQYKDKEYDQLVNIEIEESDFDKLNIDDCVEEFSEIRNWKETPITPTSNYYNYINYKNNNKLSKEFGFNKCTFSEIMDEDKYKKHIRNINRVVELSSEIKLIIQSENYLNRDDIDVFESLEVKMLLAMKKQARAEWITYESIKLEKFTIDSMKKLCTCKSGAVTIPTSTGLLDLYQNTIKLKHNIDRIRVNIEKNHVEEKKIIGELPEKGEIYLKKVIYIDPTSETGLKVKNKNVISITNIREVIGHIDNIAKTIFVSNKKQNIQKLNELLVDIGINSLRDFVAVKGNVCDRQGEPYDPSSGEQTILLLTNTIIDDSKNYYILDEPEMSLGHKYINDFIVKRITELAKMNKTIVVSTHDANMAVRTLPLSVIYREYCGENKYKTYIGNPFIDKLEDTEGKCSYSWTRKCLEMLEGGEAAFIERGSIYGK